MPVVTVNGVELFYEVEGRGPSLVVVHGGWTDHTVWQSFADELMRSFRVIGYDRRGYSRSGDAPAPRTRRQADVAPLPRRIVLHLDEGADAAFLEDLKHVVCGARGDYELWLKVGQRTLVLGEEFRVSPNCRHELAELAGVVSLAA